MKRSQYYDAVRRVVERRNTCTIGGIRMGFLGIDYAHMHKIFEQLVEDGVLTAPVVGGIQYHRKEAANA
jgi:hypothetical protein